MDGLFIREMRSSYAACCMAFSPLSLYPSAGGFFYNFFVFEGASVLSNTF